MPKEEVDVIREYNAMHEENSRSSRLIEDRVERSERRNKVKERVSQRRSKKKERRVGKEQRW